MNYVQRCKYSYNHELSSEVHDKVHLCTGDKTLCGKVLDEMWMITGTVGKNKITVNCEGCNANEN